MPLPFKWQADPALKGPCQFTCDIYYKSSPQGKKMNSKKKKKRQKVEKNGTLHVWQCHTLVPADSRALCSCVPASLHNRIWWSLLGTCKCTFRHVLHICHRFYTAVSRRGFSSLCRTCLLVITYRNTYRTTQFFFLNPKKTATKWIFPSWKRCAC